MESIPQLERGNCCMGRDLAYHRSLLQKVFVTGEAIMLEDQLVPFYRNGKVEDIYWTFTYSPALGEDD
jgi:hypothetical protein